MAASIKVRCHYQPLNETTDALSRELLKERSLWPGPVEVGGTEIFRETFMATRQVAENEVDVVK